MPRYGVWLGPGQQELGPAPNSEPRVMLGQRFGSVSNPGSGQNIRVGPKLRQGSGLGIRVIAWAGLQQEHKPEQRQVFRPKIIRGR